MVPRTGVEPTTLSLGRICSIQLSYRGMGTILTDTKPKVWFRYFSDGFTPHFLRVSTPKKFRVADVVQNI